MRKKSSQLDLFSEATQLAKEVQKINRNLGHKVVEGDTGAGQVKVRLNGYGHLVGVKLELEILKAHDPELLEEMIIIAAGVARKKLNKIHRHAYSEMQKQLDSIGSDLAKEDFESDRIDVKALPKEDKRKKVGPAASSPRPSRKTGRKPSK